MPLVRTAADVDPPFGPAIVGRGLRIHGWIVDPPASRGGTATAKDVSGSRWQYRLRTWTSDDDTNPVHDAQLTKGAADDEGEVDHYLSCGATAYTSLRWEIVEVDTDNADASSRTGDRELVLMRWLQPIVEAP